MNIVKLSKDDYNIVLDLFMKNFINDHFYVEMFPEEETRYEKLKEISSYPIMYCLTSGYSFGAFKDNALIGFILCFDYSKCISEDRQKIFGDSSVIPNILLTYGSNVMYEMSIAINEEYRRLGYATQLVNHVLKQSTGYTLVSDVSNEGSLGVYKSLGFEINQLSKGYYFVSSTSHCL